MKFASLPAKMQADIPFITVEESKLTFATKTIDVLSIDNACTSFAYLSYMKTTYWCALAVRDGARRIMIAITMSRLLARSG